MSFTEYFREKGHQVKEFDEGLLAYVLKLEDKEPHAVISVLHVNQGHKKDEIALCKQWLGEMGHDHPELLSLVSGVGLMDPAKDLLRMQALGFQFQSVTGPAIVLTKRV